MSDDPYHVRERDLAETGQWLEAEQARRRVGAPGLEDIRPAQVAARVQSSGPRPRLSGVRVSADAYSWRWPWATQERVDVVDCDLEGVEIKPGLLRSSTFNDCRFERVAMGGAKISGTTFIACGFEKVTLSGIATGAVRHSTFRECSFTDLNTGSAHFDGVTFTDCDINGLRGGSTFRKCSFLRTRFRGKVRSIGLVDCTFAVVDMSEARASRLFIDGSRVNGELVYPAKRSGFAIEYHAFRATVEDLAPSLSDADGDALRSEVRSWATNPPAEVVIDDETLRPLTPDGRVKATDALFDRRLVRRG